MCGAPLIWVENEKCNTLYVVKVNTWVCLGCYRTIEEIRKVEGCEYK